MSRLARVLNVAGKFIDRIRTIVQLTPYLLLPANAPQVNDYRATAEQMYKWDVEVSLLMMSLGSSGPYENSEEALQRTLCFDGGPFYQPASPEIIEASKAWRQRIPLAHQFYSSSRFASLRNVFPFLLNVSFLSYGMRLLLARQTSLYGAFRWLLVWAIAQRCLCTMIDRAALALDRNFIDVGKLQTQIDELAQRCRPFEQLFGRFTLGRRFCITERGHMGWVSLAA